MFFSNREKSILQRLIDYRNGVSVEELQDLLGVSKRTVYREISSIEKSLHSLEVQVLKPRGEGYRLVGNPEAIEQLTTFIHDDQTPTFDSVQRQSALACLLLLATEEVIIEGLANDLEVSVGTIHSDLQAVEESFSDYHLSIVRKKGRGIEVLGGEIERRQILSNLIYHGISEYDFFHFLHKLDAHHLPTNSRNFFLNLIEVKELYAAKISISKHTKNLFTEVTDNQLQQLIIGFALSLHRIRTGHFLRPTSELAGFANTSYELAEKMIVDVHESMNIPVHTTEITFLAKQLDGVNYKKTQSIFLENFDVELSFRVRAFIQAIAKETGIDFRQDEALFFDLLAHMGAALKRKPSVLQLSNNPLLEKIIEEYPFLYKSIKQELPEVFPEQTFSLDEQAYVVIHFATSLEKNPGHRAISALVLCTSGIGTSRILENRIEKYISEIQTIKIAKISQMSHLDFQEYDLILSTVFLPGFTYPYKMISPLLLDKEIIEIKTLIDQEALGVSRMIQPKTSVEPANRVEDFEEIYDTMKIANDVLKNFSLKTITAQKNLEDTLQIIMNKLEGIIVSDSQKTTAHVLHRYQVAPIGIPGTNFALFHSANSYVKKPFFSIFDLSHGFNILGMDKKEMQLQRILLMLAPDPLPENQQKLLGKISSSVIESDLNMEIYKHGSEDLIYKLLSQLFVNEIKDIQ